MYKCQYGACKEKAIGTGVTTRRMMYAFFPERIRVCEQHVSKVDRYRSNI